MRLGTGQGAGAVVMERCCAASFHQNGLECTGQKESSHEQAEGSETSGAYAHVNQLRPKLLIQHKPHDQSFI